MRKFLSTVVWAWAIVSLWSAGSVEAQCHVATIDRGAVERALERLASPHTPHQPSPWSRLRVLVPKRARWRYGQARQEGLGQYLDSNWQRRERTSLGQRSSQVFELTWNLAGLWPSKRSRRTLERTTIERIERIEPIAARAAKRLAVIELARQRAVGLPLSDPRCDRLRTKAAAAVLVLRTTLPGLRSSRRSRSVR